MIVYRVKRMHTPDHLLGMPLARWQGEQYDLLAHDDHVDLLPPVGAKFVKCGDYEVALIGKLEPIKYFRDIPWTAPIIFRDGQGVYWPCPLLLSPEGYPVVDLRLVFDDEGGIKQEPVDDAQKAAVEAAIWARGQIAQHGDLHQATDAELAAAAMAVLSAAYYLDSRTMGKLGLLTMASCRGVLRTAAGVMDEGNG